MIFKKIFFPFITLLFLLISCSSDTEIDGVWSIKDDFYTAKYKIGNVNNKKKVQVLFYDDGTTKFTSITKPNIFLFSNLRKVDEIYIDAISGATKVKHKNQIKIVSKDTLEVTNYINHKPIKEYWTRTNNQK